MLKNITAGGRRRVKFLEHDPQSMPYLPGRNGFHPNCSFNAGMKEIEKGRLQK
jgi:hypothetical protein